MVFIVGGGGGVGVMESIWDWNYNFIIHFHWNSSGHLWKSCDFSVRVTCLFQQGKNTEIDLHG